MCRSRRVDACRQHPGVAAVLIEQAQSVSNGGRLEELERRHDVANDSHIFKSPKCEPSGPLPWGAQLREKPELCLPLPERGGKRRLPERRKARSESPCSPRRPEARRYRARRPDIQEPD